tara:strand:+ start:5465 stop:6595 length:1131 start_codon:yes stop_codon:yes gene_type:complete
MKWNINRDHFATGLQQVLNVVGTRTAMPILSNVLIQAKDDKLTLTTTNLDLGIQCHIKADIDNEGSITLPVRKLATIIRSLPTSDVCMEISPSYQAKITSGGSLFRVMGMAPEEFPPLPSFSSQKSLSFKQEELSQMLKCVSYAQSGDENRYILNGVYFNFLPEKLSLVATDGRRLSLITKDMAIDEQNTGNFILPAKTVAEVSRLLGQGESTHIVFNDRQVAFDIQLGDEAQENGLTGSIYLVSKTVEGNYPNYKQVIPKQTEYRIKVERELLQECVQRAALVTSDKSNSVKVRVCDNVLEVSASSPEYGESHEPMAVAYEGPEVQVAFNPQFILDPLKALPKDEIFFEFKDELSPGVFKTLDNFLCVIMPLRLN